MQDEANDSDLVDSKKKQASEQVLSFYEVYTYHVLQIICGIIFIGVPLIYSLKIGRSGILSGVLNFTTSGYCSPFNKPFISNASQSYHGNTINQAVEADPTPDDDNTIITDDISFYVSLQQCIKDTFKFSSDKTEDGNPEDDKTPNEGDSVCKITYGKLIKFTYEANVIPMLSSSYEMVNKWIQMQNWIQYTEMDPVPSLSDQVITKWNYAKNEDEPNILTYVSSILYMIFINFPLDTFRRLLVLAIVLYDLVFGFIINFFTYWLCIPYSFFEIFLLFLPSLLMLALPLPTFFSLIYNIFKIVSYLFISCFTLYYIYIVVSYIIYIAKSYSKAADKVDMAFYSIKILMYIGAIIIIILLIIQMPLLLAGLCITVQSISIFIMIFILILPLFFKADIINEPSKKYSFISCIRGLKYKQSYILLLLLLVFIYDLFTCKVVSIGGGSLGSIFLFLIILLIFSYFNNTLIHEDTKKNGFLSSYAINAFKEEALKNSNMIEITKENYEKYSKSNRITYNCSAKFGDSTTLLESYNYGSYSIGGFVIALIKRYLFKK
jgi:hypothetical protein